MTPLDFYSWGHIKSLIYETPDESERDLIEKTAVAAGQIAENIRIFLTCPAIHSEEVPDLHCRWQAF